MLSDLFVVELNIKSSEKKRKEKKEKKPSNFIEDD